MRIRHEQFPLMVTEPDHINSAAVLRAAGMIEGRVPLPHQGATGLCMPPAVIDAITPFGRHEIANRLSPPALDTLARPSPSELLMPTNIPPPLRYLLHIERGFLPLMVKDPEEIAHIRALLAAGFIEATIPPPSRDRASFGTQPPATVQGLTRYGRLEVQRLQKTDLRRSAQG